MKSENEKRSYYIIRVHENGEASEIDILPATHNSDDTLTFTTDRFSTYAVAYAEPNDTVVVTEATMDKESVTITEKGGSVQLSVSVAPANAPNKKVTWTSSNTAVATVDENGKVTAVGNGTCIITVTTEDEGKTDTCTITVEIPEKPETPGGNTENNGNTDTPNTPNLPDADKPNKNQSGKEDSKDSQAAQTQDISDSNFRISLMLFSAAVVAGIRVRKKKYCR